MKSLFLFAFFPYSTPASTAALLFSLSSCPSCGLTYNKTEKNTQAIKQTGLWMDTLPQKQNHTHRDKHSLTKEKYTKNHRMAKEDMGKIGVSCKWNEQNKLLSMMMPLLWLLTILFVAGLSFLHCTTVYFYLLTI